MARTQSIAVTARSDKARVPLLEAAKLVLRKDGFSGLSTRSVATAAGMPMSQIHYHFGSKEGLMLALFEYLNEQLLERQVAMFGTETLRLSEQWDLACDYLDEDLASGYVRVLQELWAASYSNPRIAEVVSDGIMGWMELLLARARIAEERFGPLGPFTPEEVAALVGNAFIGGEAYILLGTEKRGLPVRQSLRRVGDLIRMAENLAGH